MKKIILSLLLLLPFINACSNEEENDTANETEIIEETKEEEKEIIELTNVEIETRFIEFENLDIDNSEILDRFHKNEYSLALTGEDNSFFSNLQSYTKSTNAESQWFSAVILKDYYHYERLFYNLMMTKVIESETYEIKIAHGFLAPLQSVSQIDYTTTVPKMEVHTYKLDSEGPNSDYASKYNTECGYNYDNASETLELITDNARYSGCIEIDDLNEIKTAIDEFYQELKKLYIDEVE